MENNETEENPIGPKVSTRSYKFKLNCHFDLDKLKNIPREKYFVIKKVRGRRRKIDEFKDINNHLSNGTLIYKVNLTVDGKEDIPKKKKEFPNSKTFILFLIENGVEKLINFKVFRNGSIQMSGVKQIDQAFKTVETFFKIVMEYEKMETEGGGGRDTGNIGRYLIKHSDTVKLYCIPFLCNMSFNVGFMINRDKLDEYINIETEYKSHWEGVGYAAVRVYFPLVNFEKDITVYVGCLRENEVTRGNREWDETTEGNLEEDDIDTPKEDNTWEYSQISYRDYLSIFPSEKVKKKYITFHVFHTGKINTSSIDETITYPYYTKFLDILSEAKEIIRV